MLPQLQFPAGAAGESPRHLMLLHPRAAAAAGAGSSTHVRFWRPLSRAVVDLVCGEVAARDLPMHATETVRLTIPFSRFAIAQGLGRTTPVGPGIVHVTTAQDVSGACALDGEPVAMGVLYLPADTLAKAWASHAGGPWQAAPALSTRAFEDGALYAELRGLFDALRGPLVSLDCAERLLVCLGQLLARHGERPSEPATPLVGAAAGLERVRAYLRAHVADHLGLDAVADVACLSKFYLVRAFARTYGLPPHAYQMALRLARARRLIEDGRPLSHVTYDAGFADQSHLTRRFKAAFGVTPAAYGRQLATNRAADRRLHIAPARTGALPPAA
jgi:AraC-like DNA-binding protein